MLRGRKKQFKQLRHKQSEVKKGPKSTKNLSSQWKNLERGRDKMKKREQRALEKKLVTRSLIWLILLGEINFNTETS